jgi:hypothetical protein
MERAIAAVKAGATVSDAARSAGVHPASVRKSPLYRALPARPAPERVAKVSIKVHLLPATVDMMREQAAATGTSMSAIAARILDNARATPPATPDAPATPRAAPVRTLQAEVTRDDGVLMGTLGSSITVFGNDIDELMGELATEVQNALDSGDDLTADPIDPDADGVVEVKISGRKVVAIMVVREPAKPEPRPLYAPDPVADDDVLKRRAAEIDGQVAAIEARLAAMLAPLDPNDKRVAIYRESAAKQIKALRP